MTRQDILTQLSQIITTNFNVPPDRITPEVAWRSELGLDSLDLVDLTFFIKHEFGVDEELKVYSQLQTVSDVVDLIATHLEARA